MKSFSLQFNNKICLVISWDSDGKLFLHKDGKPIVYTRTQMSIAKLYKIEYQEIQLYTMTIIKTKLYASTIDDQRNYLLTVDSTFIHNNPDLKCHPTLINSNKLCHNSNFPLTLTSNPVHKHCIPCNITIGTLETINNLNYNINDFTFDTMSEISFQHTDTIKPILNDHKPQHDTNTGLHPHSYHANKINFHHIKTQNATANVKADDHNNTSIKPFWPFNKINTGYNKQLPSPTKDLKVITLLAEVNYHRKITLKDTDIGTNTKGQLAAMCKDYNDIFSKHMTNIGKTDLIQMYIQAKEYQTLW